MEFDIQDIVDDYLESIDLHSIEDIPDFIKTINIIFEILKSDPTKKIEDLYEETGILKDYFSLCRLKKLRFSFDPKLSTWQIVKNLLESARNEGKDGTVAQHLVGAKLKLRFPELEIENNAASTADRPTGRHGDFFVGDTAFHVTVAPMTPVFEKCLINVSEGFKAYVVVPAAKLNAAREMAQQICGGQIAVESLESFVSQNIDELSQFRGDTLKTNFVELVKIYNKRVDAVEIDKSLMIELPSSLEK